LEVLKGKSTKSIGIMPHLKLLETYVFGTKKLKNKQKLKFIWTYELCMNILIYSQKHKKSQKNLKMNFNG
jgi:hypothetical protein